jgi:peptide/nickel transport system substrate-binding protein
MEIPRFDAIRPTVTDRQPIPRRPLWMVAMTALASAALTAAACVFADGARAEPKHAIAMHGQPALPPGFSARAYVNPDAPRGGRLTHGVLGTFDSLNPFVVKGIAPPYIRGYVVESLLARGYDEPFTLYGLLADRVETDDARSFVTFHIDPAAAFSDGKPVTAEDVIFSWQLLRDKGRPNFRIYYAKVKKADAIDARTVRFDLTDSDDRELPLILGLMPILAKHAIDPEKFEETTFAPPVATGPYVVADVNAGRSLTLKRNPDYWGRDRAINRGLWNFDEIRIDFFRDANAHFEAFARGLYDVRSEHDAGRWETAYDVPALREGRFVKEAYQTGLPKGLSAFIFNTRRPVFADIRVREALTLLFDAEWVNQNFFFNRYRRTASYYEGSELSAHGRPADAIERGLLKPFPGAVRADVLEGQWSPPKTDGSGRDRATLRRALGLLREAGWDLVGTELRSRKTGQPFVFEFLVTNKEQERLAIVYGQHLKRAGIAANLRVVDAVQYDRRRIAFDFDMIEYRWDQSLSPGNEQAFYWGSEAADQHGTRNYMGVKSPAIDALIAAMLRVRGRGP